MRKTALAAVLTMATIWTAMAAWAAPKTVTLSVPDMNCAVCPLTVKTSLEQVNGVSNVEVSLERREATVTFDDARTDVNALREATANAGYPSTVKP